MKSISWKPVIIAAVFLTAIVYVLPTFIPGFPLQKKINLGLDLQGGMHLVLEVETDKAVEGTLERTAQELKERSRRAKVRRASIDKTDDARIEIRVQGAENIEAFENLLDEEFRNLRIQDRTREGERLSLLLDLPDQETERIKELAVGQALETIRNRIDQFGVSEPDIRRQGERRLLIQLPGVKDTDRAKELIGRTAQLEFKLLYDRLPARKALE